MNFEVGEWAMLGYQPVQIKENRGGGSYVVSTGTIETSGQLGDRLYPMSLQNKGVADSVSHYRREMGDLCRSVNWPEIASFMEFEAAAASDNKEKQEALLETLRKMNRQLQDLHDTWFENTTMRIFRR